MLGGDKGGVTVSSTHRHTQGDTIGAGTGFQPQWVSRLSPEIKRTQSSLGDHGLWAKPAELAEQAEPSSRILPQALL